MSKLCQSRSVLGCPYFQVFGPIIFPHVCSPDGFGVWNGECVSTSMLALNTTHIHVCLPQGLFQWCSIFLIVNKNHTNQRCQSLSLSVKPTSSTKPQAQWFIFKDVNFIFTYIYIQGKLKYFLKLFGRIVSERLTQDVGDYSQLCTNFVLWWIFIAALSIWKQPKLKQQ